MTSCEEVQNVLSWYLRGALESAESRAVIEHLLTCAACREELAQAVRLESECAKAFQAMPPAPATAWATVAARTGGVRLARLDLGSFLAGLSIGMSFQRGRLPVFGQLRLLGPSLPLFETRKGSRND